MGVHSDYDDGVPLRFVYDRFTANAAFMAQYGDRFYEDVRVPAKAPDNHITIKCQEINVALWAGLPEYIGKVASEVKIYNVRKYPTGKGSEMDFRSTMILLRRVLCGVNFAEVFFEGAKIGEVHESTFLRKLPLIEYGDGNFDTLKKGITIRVIHR